MLATIAAMMRRVNLSDNEFRDRRARVPIARQYLPAGRGEAQPHNRQALLLRASTATLTVLLFVEKVELEALTCGRTYQKLRALLREVRGK
jgi:hypothetical protein